MKPIHGNKGGKSGVSNAASATAEAPNTLQTRATARVIDIISHGECVGLADRVDLFKSIYYDDVPIQNDDDSFNYHGITISERVGLPDQSPFPGFSDVEFEHGIGLEILYATPRVVIFESNDIDAVRVKIRINGLTQQDSETGELKGYFVKYIIQRRISGGAWEDVVSEYLQDKCTSAQELSYVVDKPVGADSTNDWEIKCIRVDPDNASVTVADDLFLMSVTEIVHARLQYADLGGVAQEVDAKQFGERVPPRSFDWVGLVLDVPVNYTPPNYDDPTNQSQRVYTGLWNGAFKRAWTDNPAWFLWGLLTDPNWGLGRVIKPELVDKWTLYQIAKYCDEFVPDGFGGYEPRYRINTQISSAENAYTVLQAVASIFRGMVFWGSGTVTFTADMPQDAKKLVSQANVISGEFNYQGTSLKGRHSVARVTWNDPTDGYKQAVEVVEDPEMIDRFGYRAIDLTAYGCTSHGQATRMGKWALDTERYENELVTYRASFDHADVRPGHIVAIYDPYYAGVRMAGRATAVTTTSLTVDSPVTINAGETYTLHMTRPDGALFSRALTNAQGSTSTLTWSSTVETLPAVSSTVLIFSETVPVQRGAIMSITTTSVTFRESIELITGYTYKVGFTLPDGSVVSRTITNGTLGPNPGNALNTQLKTLNWASALSTMPDVGTIGFVYVEGEGYLSSTISSRTATSCVLNTGVALLIDYSYVAQFTFPDGSIALRKLTNTYGTSVTNLTWDDSLVGLPQVGSMWGVTSSALEPREFRVLSVKEAEQNIFEVVALNYDRNKYARIEEGLSLPEPTTTTLASKTPPTAPTNLTAYRRPTIENGQFIEKISVFWDASTSPMIYKYRLSWKKDNNTLKTIEVFSNSAELDSEGVGNYTFTVIAINQLHKTSAALIKTLTLEAGKPFGDAIVTNLHLESQLEAVTEWTGADLKIAWDVDPPADWWDPSGTNWSDPYFKDFEVKVLTSGDVLKGTFYTTDRRFVLSRERNAEINGGSPLRTVKMSVSMRDVFNTTFDPVTKTVSNPAPAAPTVTIAASVGSFTITTPRPTDLDYVATKVWVSTTNGFDPAVVSPAYDAPQTTFSVTAVAGTTYYVRVAHYDDFSTAVADLNVSTQYSVTGTTITSGDLDTTPPAVPTGLALDTPTIVLNADGTQTITLRASWSAVGDADINHYDVALQPGSGAFIVSPTAGTSFDWIINTNVTYTVKVRAVDHLGNASAYSSTVSTSTTGDTTAPSAPTTIIAVGTGAASIRVGWINPSDADLKHIEIWQRTENTTPLTSETTYRVMTLAAGQPGVGKSVTLSSGLLANTTYYFWLRAIDTSGNASGFTSVVSTKPGKVRASSTTSRSPNHVPDNGMLDEESWTARTV